jgi:AI-2 transport protein TqsA
VTAQRGVPGAEAPQANGATGVPPAAAAEAQKAAVQARAAADIAAVPGTEVALLPEDVLGAPTGGMPRWMVLLVGAATATIAIAGVRSIAWLVGPVQRFLQRHGWPRWASATVLLLLVWAILLGFVALLVISIAQFAALLPNYAGSAEALIASVVSDLNDRGIVSGQLSDLVAQFDYSQLVGVATGVLSRATDAASTLVLLLAALVFLSIEAGGFGRRLALVAADRPHLPIALGLFARGTRSYLWVSTVFGGIVAVGDGIALAIIGIPLPVVWGLLSFVTNYVPNIGFVLGLVPPAILALLDGGWTEFWVVVAVYALLNFVVQTLIQPRFVGDSVGLSMTVTFVALLFWGWVLGALGALLAIPLTLLLKALLVDVDPRGHWLDALLREEPRAPRTSRARQRANARRAAIASVRALHVPRPHRRSSEE